MPPGLLESYEQAMADPDLLSLRHHIAVADARLDQILAKLQTEPDSGLQWGLYRKWQDHVRKLRGEERKLLEAAQAYVTQEQLRAVAQTTVEILKRVILDKQVLMGVLTEIQALVFGKSSRLTSGAETLHSEP
jgi:hypothetical protein